MTAIADIPEAPRAARRPQIGNPVLRWLRTNLFSSIPNGILSVVLLAVLAKGVFSLVLWGIANAVWLTPANDSSACRAVRGVGACWAIIPEKYRFILFGTYPFDQQWRPALAVLLFIALFYLSTRRALWRRELAYLWIGALALISVLMWGGVFGLSFVSQDRWGGLPVTLILATFGLAFGFPLGILVALGRRSKLPAIRSLSVLYVELIPRRAAGQSVVHGERDVSAVHACRIQYRQALARADRDHPVRRCLSCRSHPRRPSGRAERTV
ncbi:hypothetical protein ACVWW4_002498 [Bradyrhizobium sp. LB7.1]